MTLGFQIVFVDEQGRELERGPDVFGRDVTWIAEGEYAYTLLQEMQEDGQTVRYFQRGQLDD